MISWTSVVMLTPVKGSSKGQYKEEAAGAEEGLYLKNPDRNPAAAPILGKPPGTAETPNAFSPSFIQPPINVTENSQPRTVPMNVPRTTFTATVTEKTANVTIQGPIISAQLVCLSILNLHSVFLVTASYLVISSRIKKMAIATNRARGIPLNAGLLLPDNVAALLFILLSALLPTGGRTFGISWELTSLNG